MAFRAACQDLRWGFAFSQALLQGFTHHDLQVERCWTILAPQDQNRPGAHLSEWPQAFWEGFGLYYTQDFPGMEELQN